MHSVSGRAHVSLRPHLPLRGPRLYILLHLLLVRFSIGLAHILCESLAHPHRIYSMRETAASSEKIPLDSRPPYGEEHQDLLTEKTGYPCIVLSCSWIVYLLLCIRGSSACVIILVGLSVLLCSPRDFPPVSLLMFFVFIMGSAPFMKDRPIGFLPYIILVSQPCRSQFRSLRIVLLA